MGIIKKQVAIFNDTSVGRHYGCSAVMTNLCTFSAQANLEPSFFWPVGVDWRPHVTRLKKVLANYQAIIVNGEGTIHNPHTRDRAKFLLELPELASELAIPIYLVNSTIHNLDSDHLKMLLRFNRIFVRDTASKKLLLNAKVSSSVVPDLSCFSPSFSHETKIKSNFRVLVTGSVVAEKDKILQDFVEQNSLDFQDLHFRKADIFTRIFSRLKRQFVYKPEKNKITASNRHDDWLRNIKKYDLVVTGRFHAVTMSLVTRTPFFAIESNTPKITNLLLDVFGNAHRVIEMPTVNHISKELKYDFNMEEREAINKYLTTGYENALRMFAEISDEISDLA